MKKSILTFGLLLMTTMMMAQYRVALHSNGSVDIYGGANPFTEAYNAAVAGDTIYLPGGNLTYPGTIDKSLTIKGVGHYPVATTEGIHLTGQLRFINNEKVDFVTLKRSRFGEIYFQGDGSTPCENGVISESIITGDLRADNASYMLVSNNIIEGEFDGGTQLSVSNNIFLSSSFHIISNVNNSNIINNIFLTASGNFIDNSSGNNFSNNIFTMTPNVGANTFLNNYKNVDLVTVFETIPPVNQFGYDVNYSLLASAQSTFLGNDGMQVGIYGGTFPFKLNSVPTNPSITSQNIAPQTNDNGELDVDVTVEAQDN